MLNDVINAISIKLNSVFGNGYEIYTENVEQGLQEPCFLLNTLKVISNHLLGKRAKRTYPFVISYFPEAGNEEMAQVGERLLEELEYITLLNGDVLRASSLEYEIVDGVLHFSVSYNVVVNDFSREEAMMNRVTSSVRTKGARNGN